MMKSSAMFVSSLVTGKSLTSTGSDDLSTSMPFCCSGSDLRETVDAKVDSFTVRGFPDTSGRAGIVLVISHSRGCVRKVVSATVSHLLVFTR